MVKIKKKKSLNPNKWEVTAKRFVGYIDIMGFKDMVSRNTHMSVYKMMKKISLALEESVMTFGVEEDEATDDLYQNVMMMIYSDSIMIYSKDTSVASLNNFIGCIAGLTDDLFKNEIPFRGAVAFGKMTLDYQNAIFFGQPLIDAYLLQEELLFYGIVIHSTAERKKGLKKDQSVRSFLCPFKVGYSDHLTITPSTLMGDLVSDYYHGKQSDGFAKLMKKVKRLRLKTSGSIRKYIDNTIQYLETTHNELLQEIMDYSKTPNKRNISKSKKQDDLPF